MLLQRHADCTGDSRETSGVKLVVVSAENQNLYPREDQNGKSSQEALYPKPRQPLPKAAVATPDAMYKGKVKPRVCHPPQLHSRSERSRRAVSGMVVGKEKP